MFVFIGIAMYVGYVCVSVYMRPYICSYIHACVCLCAHTLLLPLFSLVLERLLLRPPPWVQRACMALLESVKHDITRVRVLVSDMNVWLL